LKKRLANKPRLQVTAGLVWDGSRILITRRPPDTHMGGFWEFPGGKKEHGESLERCLKRELAEELAVEVEVGDKLAHVEYEYEDRVVELHVFHCTIVRGHPVSVESQEIRWVSPGHLDKYTFPPPDLEIIRRILDQGLVQRYSGG